MKSFTRPKLEGVVIDVIQYSRIEITKKLKFICHAVDFIFEKQN